MFGYLVSPNLIKGCVTYCMSPRRTWRGIFFFLFFLPGFFFNPFTMENLKYESRWVNVQSTHVLITQSQEPKTPSPSHLALPVSCCSIFKQTPYIIFSIYILVCISKQTKDTERFSWFLNYHDFSFFFQFSGSLQTVGSRFSAMCSHAFSMNFPK